MTTFPLSVSANKRYLVDAAGIPFRIHGEAAWSIGTELNLTDLRQYLDDRKSRGFNTLLVQPTDNQRSEAQYAPWSLGAGMVLPFLTNISGGTWDGDINNVNHDASFSQPNNTYWNWIDTVTTETEARGILLLFTHMYMGYSEAGWGATQNNAGNTQAVHFTFGQFLGNRYKGSRNLIWVLGGDWNATPGSEFEARTHKLMEGIRSVGANQLATSHWNHETLSTDLTAFSDIIQVQGVYSSGHIPKPPGILAQSGTILSRIAYPAAQMPQIFLETYYEDGSDSGGVIGGGSLSAPEIRMIYWGAALSNPAGFVFGNGSTWHFTLAWKSNLNTQGANDMTRINNLLDSIPWYDLVPSGLGNTATIVTSGGGTAGTADPNGVNGGTDWIVATATANGKYIVAYVPDTHTGAFTIDMSRMKGMVRARWFDPTNGQFQNVVGTPFVNLASKSFTVPGSNSGGNNDWVLILNVENPILVGAPVPPSFFGMSF